MYIISISALVIILHLVARPDNMSLADMLVTISALLTVISLRASRMARDIPPTPNMVLMMDATMWFWMVVQLLCVLAAFIELLAGHSNGQAIALVIVLAVAGLELLPTQYRMPEEPASAGDKKDV